MSKTSIKNDSLLLDNQVCFPLYSAANAMIRAYRPVLNAIGLTYPQYLVMLVLWQHRRLSVTEVGEKLRLDSGTLTPLLKRLEAKELVSRNRSSEDERVRIISLTERGLALRKEAQTIPESLQCQIDMPPEQAQQLKNLCLELLALLDET
jgi:DNA-binding MarR family transcriptional regulator